MSDLDYIHATSETKIVGQDATGNNVNYVSADANGNMLVKDYSDGPVTPGTVASTASLIAGQFNTTLPTLTNTQQAAIQVDSKGRLLISNSETPISTASNTIVSVSNAASTQILASNTNRRMVYISNNNNKSLWIKLGAAAVVGQGIEIGGGGTFGIDSTSLWVGTVNGIMAGGSSANIDVFEGTT